MNVQAASREEYIDIAGPRQADIEKLDQLIREELPNLEPVFFTSTSGGMLGYGMRPYQPKSAKEPGEWPQLALAVQKNYLSLYVCVVTEGRYLAEKYQSELGKVSCGKSCIRFKKFEDLDLDGLRRMFNEIHQRDARGEILYMPT
jgi:hypothetical protein